MNAFIDEYNNVNNTSARYLRNLAGYELGFGWSLLQIQAGGHRLGQSIPLENGRKRHFRFQNEYLNVLGSFRFPNTKLNVGIGMTAYFQRFIAFMEYPNGEISRAKENPLNGTYKALSANWALRLERPFSMEKSKGFTAWVHYTAPFPGTTGNFTDYNGAKGALNPGNNALTSLEINGNTRGFIFGISWYYKYR